MSLIINPQFRLSRQSLNREVSLEGLLTNSVSSCISAYEMIHRPATPPFFWVPSHDTPAHLRSMMDSQTSETSISES